MNYNESTSLRLDQLRAGVAALEAAQAQASSLRIAREGLVTNFLSGVFARASVAFQDFATAVFPKTDAAILNGFSPKETVEMESADYAKLRKVQVSTMEGFEGKYLTYGKYVLTSLSYYDNVLSVQLAEFRNLLGGIINNHEDRKSLLSLQGKYKEYRSILDSLDREVAVYWQRGSFKAIRPVGDVLDRTADVVEINRDAKLISEKLKQVSFEQVQAKVSEVRDLIKIALEVIDSKGLKEVSDPQLKNLSQGIMGLAESVEFYGLVLYRANIYVAAVARLNEAVKKIA